MPGAARAGETVKRKTRIINHMTPPTNGVLCRDVRRAWNNMTVLCLTLFIFDFFCVSHATSNRQMSFGMVFPMTSGTNNQPDSASPLPAEGSGSADCPSDPDDPVPGSSVNP